MLGRFGVDLTFDEQPEFVALMLACLKVAREAGTPTHDNRVDMCGYIVCEDDIIEGVEVDG